MSASQQLKFRGLGLLVAAVLAASLAPIAAAQGVVFSELMYHPLGTTNVAEDADDYEFLELYNPTAGAIDLSGASFTAGVSFTFPPATSLGAGAYLVVARNAPAFSNRYPSAGAVAGDYSGALANGGERVTLKDSGGTTLFDVTYDDEAGWPTRPDGDGASLRLTNMAGDPNLPTSWCASDEFLGSPNAAGTCASNDVVINEILAHTDLPQKDSIELHNTTAAAIAIGGWYLSDDDVVRAKFRIPLATVLPAGGYIVFDEDDFNDTNDLENIAFALSEHGERLFLTAADASSNLTRFVDAVDFAASANGVSFGRYPNGTGGLETMAELTFGASNGLPLVGPIVIAEIMYHPADNSAEKEYLELLNTSTGAVALFDPAIPTNTWRLDTAVDFSFPTNVTVAAGERILVTGATDLDAFRAAYGLAATVQVFGAWSGKLDNAGESVRLYKPGSPDAGQVPYILVDRVDYDDESPWPIGPDGNGPSLERVVETNFGNAVDNWFTGPPGGTPGAAAVGGFVDPLLLPTAPAPGQSVTVSVAVVAQVLPTQVVVEVSMDGSNVVTVLVDDGTQGDTVSGDQRYTGIVTASATPEWLYYRFEGYRADGQQLTWPSDILDFVPAPTLTLRLSGNGLRTTIEPPDGWQTFATTGLATHASSFYIYLDSAGEVLVDDVSIVDVATLTEHVDNGAFTNTLWPWTATNNHSGSVQTNFFDEGTNGVLHVIASGAGSGGVAGVNATLNPALSLGQPHVLSFRARRISVVRSGWLWTAIGTPPPDPVVNEIMYHPVETNETALEYVELYNPASTTSDLAEATLSGVGFLFPQGAELGPTAYVVCASAQASIQARYGITNTIGNWTGRLQNDGETLRLVNRFGRELDRVTYDCAEPWPAAADGLGPSLERLNPWSQEPTATTGSRRRPRRTGSRSRGPALWA